MATTFILALSPAIATSPSVTSPPLFPSRRISSKFWPCPSKPHLVRTSLAPCKDPFRLFVSHPSRRPSPPEVEEQPRQVRRQALVRRLLLCALACSLAAPCWPSLAAAAEDSIGASGIGLKVAVSLRRLGWADEAVVFALATLPVLELRGAIPVGYWMRLHPLRLTVLAVLGNMVPVPIIILYLKRFATSLSHKNSSATRFLDRLFKSAREKAGPVEEFQWLGLMLFVAVPFPGTGAWTGAFIAAILDMPFWSAVSANFVGVVLAGLLVNLLVSLGIKYAVVLGVLLFFVSTVMWSILRKFKMSLNSN